jgi:hypothetical protein
MTRQRWFLFPWNALEEKPPVRGMEVHKRILPEQELIFNALIAN